MEWVWNLMNLKKFNKDIAKMITLVDWYGLNKDSKFISNTFIWDLIVEFYKAPQKKSKLVAIPSVGSFQHYFW
jgi:hypothetical protein